MQGAARSRTSICIASSRVGARTRIDGPWRGSTREASTLRKPGTRKPKVLPEPVLATPITSRFAIAAGHVCAWMTEGASKPACAIAPMIGPGRAAAWKVRKGGGARPYTLTSFFAQKAAVASQSGLSAPPSCTSL